MKILVATASTYGSTQEIGEHVAAELREAGHDVEARDVEEAGPLDYDAVIVGAAIYIGRPLTAARKFTARLEREFGPKPVWVFASGMKNVTRDPLHPPYTEPASRPYLGSRYPIFKGKVDPTQLSAAERTLAALTAASVQDERDFRTIGLWARAVASHLAESSADTELR